MRGGLCAAIDVLLKRALIVRRDGLGLALGAAHCLRWSDREFFPAIDGGRSAGTVVAPPELGFESTEGNIPGGGGQDPRDVQKSEPSSLMSTTFGLQARAYNLHSPDG